MAYSFLRPESFTAEVPLMQLHEIEDHRTINAPGTLGEAHDLAHAYDPAVSQASTRSISPVASAGFEAISGEPAEAESLSKAGGKSPKPDPRVLRSRYGGVSGLFTDAWMLAAPILCLVLAILIAKANGRPAVQPALENAVRVVCIR